MVAPKQAALKIAEGELNIAMTALEKKRAMLRGVQEKLRVQDCVQLFNVHYFLI